MPRSAPRTKIAAAGTLAALGALAAVATASNSGQPGRPAQAAPAAPAAAIRRAPVRTVVVHRTVGVLTRFVPATGTQAAAAHASPKAKHVAVAVAQPARVTPSASKRAPQKESGPSSSGDDAADLPQPGVTDDECLPATTGGAPQAATSAGAPAIAALATTSRVDRAERRARRRALRRAQRRALRAVHGGRPLRSSHPLPEDAPGTLVEGCDLAPVPGAADPAAAAGAPVADAPAVLAP